VIEVILALTIGRHHTRCYGVGEQVAKSKHTIKITYAIHSLPMKTNPSIRTCITLLLGVAAAMISTSARATTVLFDQMTNYSTTGFVVSSWFPPNGFDSDT